MFNVDFLLLYSIKVLGEIMQDILNGIDLSTLSEKERKAVFEILNEVSKDGQSKKYNDILYADYNEVPVDIETFLKDRTYMGNSWHLPDGSFKLYPFWLNKLKQLFPNNIDTSVNNFIESGARGLGKSDVAVAIMQYLMYRVMCLKNPLAYFNMRPSEKIAFSFMNITEALAYDIGVSKFQSSIQLSPWFMERGTLSGTKEIMWNPPTYINIIIGSQPRHVIGQACFASFFDEISFIPTQDLDKQKRRAIDMIDTAIGGMKTRFTQGGKNPGIVILASSKRSEKSFLEEHMKKKAISEGDNTMIVDEAVWDVKPKGTYSDKTFRIAVGNRFLTSQIIKDDEENDIYTSQGYKIINAPIDLKPDFIDDIDRALCDFAGISSSDLSTYISGVRWEQCKCDDVENPFIKDIIEVGNAVDDKQQYSDFFDLSRVPSKLKSKPLFIHLDMSISGDKTGIGGTWIYGKKPSEPGRPTSNDLYFQPAFAVSVKAPKGYQISFEKNRQFIRWLRQQGFNIKLVSADTFQSYDLLQQLKTEHFNTDILSVDRVSSDRICIPYQYFRSVIYEQRLRLFKKCDTLTNEVISLERNNNTGKIDHPDHGCFTGDTNVSLIDGREVSFFDLVKEWEDGKDNFVYSINLEKGIIEPKKINKAWRTKKDSDLVAVTLDNGEIIKCTPDHKFMTKDGNYVQAQDLLPGESLMSLCKKYFNEGTSDYKMYYEPIKNKWHFEHKRVAIKIYGKKYLVRHRNFKDNSLNNVTSNEIQQKISKQTSLRKWCNNGIIEKFLLKNVHIQNVSVPKKINHKVVSIQVLNERADVYDIEIEDNHNFALSSGVFVHNSKDIADAMCGSIFQASKYADQYVYEYGDDLETSISVSMTNNTSDLELQQINIDFEDEMKKAFSELHPNKNAKDIDFGFGPAKPVFDDSAAYVSQGIMVW